jgi:hypothetical protein
MCDVIYQVRTIVVRVFESRNWPNRCLTAHLDALL